jgi:nitroimidazol reductase NimA-like FMN-containing flavoprotein (pyridoxamine 5'-phosphate oxidase superfamily)
MIAHQDGQPVATLEPPDCWAALRTTERGRLAFSVGDQPEVFPINFVVDHGTVVFRTSSTSLVAQAMDGRPVAFEADGRTGDHDWSVVVKGQAREITGLYESLEAAELPIHPEQPGPKSRVARITPTAITGRRFPVAGPQTWDNPMSHASRSAPE